MGTGVENGQVPLRVHVHVYAGWANFKAWDNLFFMGHSPIKTHTNFFLEAQSADICLYIDHSGAEGPESCAANGIPIAVLTEPREIDSHLYDVMTLRLGYFAATITHDSHVLDRTDIISQLYVPGGSFLRPTQKTGLAAKFRNISISVSKKNRTEGHQLRHRVARELARPAGISVLGKGYRPYKNWKKPYQRFRFTIAVENSKSQFYFTEKLVHPLLFHCIPVYWGSAQLPEEIDERGIIRFHSKEELQDILPTLTPSLYGEMLPFASMNDLAAQNYRHGEMNLERALLSVLQRLI